MNTTTIFDKTMDYLLSPGFYYPCYFGAVGCLIGISPEFSLGGGTDFGVTAYLFVAFMVVGGLAHYARIKLELRVREVSADITTQVTYEEWHAMTRQEKTAIVQKALKEHMEAETNEHS